MRSGNVRGSLMLLAAALIWGTAFVAQSEGMNYVEPFTYNAVRMLIGGLVLVPVIFIFRKAGIGQKKRAPLKVTVTGGVVCGIVLFAASSLQQCGISMTTAGKAGFITALYIVLVPLAELFLGRRPPKHIWLCIAGAAAGFWLLCIKEGFTVNRGDLLVLCCAVFFALHIIVIDRYNGQAADAVMMSCIQFFTAGLLMTAVMLVTEKPVLSDIWAAKGTILYTGVLSSGVAYTLQILGQRRTPPAAATLLMSLESVFAALSGWLILHETLTGRELAGCVLVFAAVILAQLRPSARHKELIAAQERRIENEEASE